MPHPLLWILGAVVVAALIAWPLGGWNDAVLESREVATLPTGATFRGNEMDVTVESIVATRVSPNGWDYAEEGTRYLVVMLDVVLNDTEPRPLGTPIEIPGVVAADSPADVTPEFTMLMADGTYSSILNPGVPTRFAWVWVVPDEWVDEHPSVRVGMIQYERISATIFAGSYWRDVGIGAYQDVPLEIDDTPIPEDEL